MHFLLLPLVLSVGDAPKAATEIVVVCPAEFREALQPWLDRRQAQGHVLELISNRGSAIEIREKIRAAAKNGKLRYVVLVGNAPGPDADDIERAHCTPTFRVPSKVSCKWGGDAEFATDNPYADLDDDDVPELAVGRLTAHTSAELSGILKKILAYESSNDFGPWRARINFVAGEGGYGGLIDSIVEVLERKAIGLSLPGAYQCTLTNALWWSGFCPDPRGFHACSLQRMDEGCLFWVFMGHGSPRTLQWAMFPDGYTPILRCEDCANLRCGDKPAIAMCMCCFTGAFAEHEDCLAEELLRSPGGPVAVLAGSNVTMPYGMAAMSQQAIREYFEGRRQTLGEWSLATKRSTMAGYDLPIWSLMHALTVSITPGVFEPKEERLEHLRLFNLFGDPTMPLRQPREVEIAAPATALSGDRIVVRGKCSIEGQATVELVTPMDQLRTVWRERYDGSTKGRQQFDTTYRAANDRRLSSAIAEVHDGGFSANLSVPADAAGRCRVRVFIEGDNDFAVGSARVQIAMAKIARGENVKATAESNGKVIDVGLSKAADQR